MRRIAVVATLLLLAACGGRQAVAPPSEPAVPPTPEEVERDIGRRVDAYRQAWEERSADGLAGVYSQSDDLIVVTQGRAARGWGEARDAMAAFLAGVTEVKLRLTDVRVHALGEGGAVATASVHRTFGDGVQTIDERGALVLVFRREAGVWRIVAESYGYAPPQ